VVEVLRQNGVEVIGIVSIFNYQFQVSKEAFEKAGVPFISLTDYPSLLNLAEKKGLIQPAEQEVLLNWRNDPANWSGLS
jgi:orotate phosphoribosyltransferase